MDLPLAVAEAASLYMVHSDHLGRPIRMTDATKATVFQAIYKPYGEVQSTSGTKALNLRFPGQYFQIETGLTYNWHRHYDPVTGRYTQVDPLRFVDEPSVYGYARGSPFIYKDRAGLYAPASGNLQNPSASNGSGATCNQNDNQVDQQVAVSDRVRSWCITLYCIIAFKTPPDVIKAPSPPPPNPIVRKPE